MEIYSALDSLREYGMELLEKYSDILDQDHQQTLIGLLESEKTLDMKSETFGNDVGYYLNLIIQVLTSYEDRMTKQDQEEFEEICRKSLVIPELSKYHVGQLIVYKKLPYQIYEIDYDDLSILIGDLEEGEFWVGLDELNLVDNN